MKTAIPIVTLAIVASACSGTQPSTARTPVAPPAPTTTVSVGDDGRSPSKSVINISEDIRRACGITDADAHFAFDSARVRSIDYPTLDKLVRCFASGPLATRQMRLVSHADPRGSEEYNIALGGSRADGVRTFLVGRGLRGEQVATTSRGEMDAKGTNEASWVEDRRVDVHLAN
jgi:peptidoglycan-associated lipoprotein